MLENSWFYLLFPVIITVFAVWNLYDDLTARILHAKGVPCEATVTKVKRSLPKDRPKLFSVNTKDVSNTYDVKCDYILSLRYSRGGEEIEINDLIVPSTIKMSGGLAFPLFKTGDTVPIRRFEKWKRPVVVDRPEVKAAQNKVLALLLWAGCTVVAVIMLIAMLITR